MSQIKQKAIAGVILHLGNTPADGVRGTGVPDM